MEFEVRTLGSIENCFVSLPLSLIRALQSTAASGFLPPILPLELRSLRNDTQFWNVSWSGSASSTSAIEISQLYSECIGLLNHTLVKVKVIPNVPQANFVTIEPHTVDDWEILELNSEHAEDKILTQVGIVHEGMRFPLWLHGQITITFLVVSTSPKKAVVKLVPGTEVAVAPKRRKRDIDSHHDSSGSDSLSQQHVTRAPLRVQDLDKRYIKKYDIGGMEIGIALTSAIFIHPESASKYSFNSLELVEIVPRGLHKETKKKNETDNQRINSRTRKEVDAGYQKDTQEVSPAVVRLLISESVAKGHVMLSRSLRLYLRAGLHSWVHLKKWNFNLKKEMPSIKLSPCQFKMFQKNETVDNNVLEALDGQKKLKTADSVIGMTDWSSHEMITAAFSNEYIKGEKDVASTRSDTKNGISYMLRAWFLAQFDAVVTNSGLEVNSVVLGDKTLLHFVVKGKSLEQNGKSRGLKYGSEILNQSEEPSVDILYVLSVSDDSLETKRVYAFDGSREKRNSKFLDALLLKLELGDTKIIYVDTEKISDKNLSLTISSLNWMGAVVSDVLNRLKALLSLNSVVMVSSSDLPLSGHILIYGPPGSGKTLLAKVVAKSVEEGEEILAHTVFINCSKLASEKQSTTINQAISGYISEALDHAPSVLIFDDLDSLVSYSTDLDGSRQSASSAVFTQFLEDMWDEYEEKRRNMCGIGPVAFIATAQSLANIPQTLSSSGRFDFHVKLPAPSAEERIGLLRQEIQKRSLEYPEETISDVALKCDGYDAYDLEILIDRSVLAAEGRFSLNDLGSKGHLKPTLVKDDVLHAMHDFLPVAMRDITKAPEGRRTGWEDVGGLVDIRNGIKEMIELPSKFPSIFSHAPLRMRSNILLYGPPGCGKTHIVGAAAASCSLRFISVKGPELLNKYIGASEQAVRDIFSKAAAAAPCLLFFDEFDSIAPKRGHDNTGVTDRIVNQFLTELDGVEVLTGVFVFAATSRPDLLDAALLRPGRLDRLLFCDFPTKTERLDILTVLARKLPLASDVDLDTIASMTDGFSGADLQALLSEAQLESVHDFLDIENNSMAGKTPVISDALLKSIASKAKPSVSESEKERLYGIYRQFLDSKRSVATQSRDAKGKRATLA